MSSNVKVQTTIPNSNIVIDCWDVKQSNGHDSSIRFMTSINNHSVQAVAQMRKANYLIYTSLFNKWYLHQFYKISEDRIMVLDHDETMEIFDSDRNEKIKVTAIEANYCSGSSMFFFQGSFGNVLYTGFFRLCSSFQVLSCPELKEVVEQNKLHVAYVDNSYAAEHCNFPSRIEMIKNIIELIRSSSNCRIVISSKPWGKEEVLLAIASELDEKIDVGPQRHTVFEKIGVVEFFTCQSKETRIRTLDHLLSLRECQKIMKQDKSCVIILMTALYKYGPKKFPSKSKYPRLFIIPYSGHCNHDELKEFVRTIKPHTILPVVLPRTDQPCSIIPKSIYNSCGKVDEPSSSVNKKNGGKHIEKSNPTVLVPRLQVSPLRLKRINGSYCPSTAITPVERSSPRSPVATRACECVSDELSSKDRSEVSTGTVNTSLSSRSNTRLSSTRASAVEKEQSLEKSTSHTHSLLQSPSCSNAILLPPNVSATQKGQSPKKLINVSIIRSINRSFNHGHPPAPSSPNAHARLSSANVSAIEEKRSTRKSTSYEHPQSVEVHANVVESVQPLSPNAACPSEEHPTGDENEQCVVYSPNDFVVTGVLNLNEVVTPLRETESEESLSKSEMGGANIPVLYSPNKLVGAGVTDLSEAVTPPLREIEREESLRKNKMDAANMPELEDPNRTTASSPDNCFIREESRNVLLDSASPHVDQNKENVTDEIPLTLRLHNDDIHSIRKDCRDMLLGPTFPRIYQREEHVEEIPSASSLGREVAFCESDYLIEDYVIEESMPSTGDICPGREVNLPSSKHSNEKAVEADSADSSMEVVDTREAASMCEVVSDTRGIKSTNANELSSNSENSLPLRTVERILNTAISSESSYNRLFSSIEKDVISVSAPVNTNHRSSISDFRSVAAKRNRSDDDVTLFELDERVSCKANVTDLASKNTTTVEGCSKSESNEDNSCVLLESSHPVNNSSHSLARASPDDRLRGSVDADQSDSDDCVVVCEYMRGMETSANVPFDRASKRMRLDSIFRSRKNDRFVNAIFFHYMKSCPDQMSNLAFDHWNFLSKCNIFSHSAYKRA